VKARVHIGFKPGVLDPQAQAIERALTGLGFEETRSVRLERVIELDLALESRERAEESVRAMCERLLANPVIETWRVELEG
jgi:phosphoribosylformylglycinamidine synthase subunit PurS